MWYLVSDPPAMTESEYGWPMSPKVLAVDNLGNMFVAYMDRIDEDAPTRWKTADSEGWDVTEYVTHWMPLPPLPSS